MWYPGSARMIRVKGPWVAPNQARQQTGHANEVCRASGSCPREPAAEVCRSAKEAIVLPGWATQRIEREVNAYLARGGSSGDAVLTRVAAVLRVWPVYGDTGGVLLLAADGVVYCRCNDTMEVRPEPDP